MPRYKVYGEFRSLGFGVLFETLITLVLVSCFYLAFEDLRLKRNSGEPLPAGVRESTDVTK